MSNENKNIAKEVAKLLRELMEQKKQERNNLKEEPVKKANGGLIEKPFYYDNYKIAPGIIETIGKLRKGFSDGGLTDTDISQIQYLVSVLEGSQNLTPHEAKILEDLYKDLNKLGVRANQK